MIHFIFNWLYFHFFKEIYLNGLIFERMALYCNNFPVLILSFKNVNSRESVTQHLCLFKKIFFCILLNYILERWNTESMVLSQINYRYAATAVNSWIHFYFRKELTINYETHYKLINKIRSTGNICNIFQLSILTSILLTTLFFYINVLKKLIPSLSQKFLHARLKTGPSGQLHVQI